MSYARVMFLAATLFATQAEAAPVLMISIDGMQPADVIDASRGFAAPNLRKLMAEGVYANGVRNALPTVTYPNHTTMITGVWPSKHGIAGNQTFDPKQQNMGGWYWYARDIKVPTLWDAVHQAGGKVASLSWPVSVGAASIDYNIPEYWRARIEEDMKLVQALSTPGLVETLQKSTGLTLAQTDGETVEVDVGRLRYTAALIAAKKPRFTTVHLRGLDHVEHESGPGSAEAKAALAEIDTAVGKLVADARKVQPDLVVAIVSDHGFAKVEKEVNLIAPFIQAGLITLDANKKVASWQAAPWGSASVAVILADPKEAAVRAKVAALLSDLQVKPELNIARIIDAKGIAQLGGTPMASFWVDFEPGTVMGQNPAAPPVGPGTIKGTHGYVPTHPEMRASFILSGKGLGKSGSLGEIDMRDIAPTLAKLMGVALPRADGKPLL